MNNGEIKMIPDHQCSKEDQLNAMHENITEIKADVKDLLSFKFQILGAISIISFLMSFAINYFVKHL